MGESGLRFPTNQEPTGRGATYLGGAHNSLSVLRSNTREPQPMPGTFTRQIAPFDRRARRVASCACGTPTTSCRGHPKESGSNPPKKYSPIFPKTATRNQARGSGILAPSQRGLRRSLRGRLSPGVNGQARECPLVTTTPLRPYVVSNFVLGPALGHLLSANGSTRGRASNTRRSR